MSSDQLVIGIDYGSDSVRSVIVNALNGQEIASSVYEYPRWRDGWFCEPGSNQFRQHPQDYIDGLEATVKDCIAQAGGAEISKFIKGISVYRPAGMLELVC